MIRYNTPPSRYDEAPFGTICTVKTDEDDLLYIQVGEEQMRWLSMGQFLEEVFKPHLFDEAFIQECLGKFRK